MPKMTIEIQLSDDAKRLVEAMRPPKKPDPKKGDLVWSNTLNRPFVVESFEGETITASIDGETIFDHRSNFGTLKPETFRFLRKMIADARELREAIGLLSTLAPEMVIDPDHPLKTAREIERHVREVFEKCDQNARIIDRLQASHNEESKQIAAKIPPQFQRDDLAESVRLLVGAFNGLAALIKINPATTDGTSFVPSQGPTT